MTVNMLQLLGQSTPIQNRSSFFTPRSSPPDPAHQPRPGDCPGSRASGLPFCVQRARGLDEVTAWVDALASNGIYKDHRPYFWVGLIKTTNKDGWIHRRTNHDRMVLWDLPGPKQTTTNLDISIHIYRSRIVFGQIFWKPFGPLGLLVTQSQSDRVLETCTSWFWLVWENEAPLWL